VELRLGSGAVELRLGSGAVELRLGSGAVELRLGKSGEDLGRSCSGVGKSWGRPGSAVLAFFDEGNGFWGVRRGKRAWRKSENG
jgi:hypothetical protein